jgi:hypothetical protein
MVTAALWLAARPRPRAKLSGDGRFPSFRLPPELNALAASLALASALTWGVADFSGGLLSRRLPTLTVTAVSQLAGFVALLVAFGLDGGALDRRSFAIGVLAGLGGGDRGSPPSTRRSRSGR